MRILALALCAILSTPFVPTAAAQTSATTDAAARASELRDLRQELARISARLAALEAESATTAPPAAASPATPSSPAQPIAAGAPAPLPRQPAGEPPVRSADNTPTLAFLRGTTFNFAIDGYYGYNFNAPIGRVNLLRAYDVSSNSFSLNQVDFMVEHLPTPQQRVGGRIDFQFGQATETLQGSSANEQRPQVWRNLYQAYGSYLAPVGSGLQLDFGKFASSLGNEGNYTKDQIAYSRAYLFNYLPFYHMGLRANYNLTPRVNVGYWLVNGAQQTEDFNGFKSQAFLFTLKPASSITWSINYYFGQEARDVEPTLYPGIPTAPTQPGLPTTNITPAPNGREHIFNTYATWQATPRLTVVGESDFVVNRNLPHDRPGRVALGYLAGKYALPRNWNIGARTEYFDDRSGLFSGRSQALKEATFSLDHTFAPGFLARAEYRRDWSNQRFFLSDTPGALLHAQTTATLGLVYWWGTKQGSW